MQRLRRPRQRHESVPVAAEVLEVRDLLSSAAAAVHGAMHHAAIQQAGGPTAGVAPGAAYHVSTQAGVSLDFDPPFFLPGTFSLSNIKSVAVGTKISAHFSFTLTQSPGTTATLKGSFSGTISSVNDFAGSKSIFLTPTGGSISYFQKNNGAVSFNVKAAPNGTPIQLVILDGSSAFVSLGGTDGVKPGGKGLDIHDFIAVSVAAPIP